MMMMMMIGSRVRVGYKRVSPRSVSAAVAFSFETDDDGDNNANNAFV